MIEYTAWALAGAALGLACALVLLGSFILGMAIARHALRWP